MANAPPAIDPANNDTLTGAFRHILGQMLENTNGMLPAKVIAYEPGSATSGPRVQVQPLIMMVTTNQESISRSQIASVPVVQYGGGGFVFNFPLNPGDLGWILANDRDISQFLQSYDESTPNTYRKNNFSDSVFIPDVMKGYAVASEDANNCVISSIDGTVKISLGATSIKMTAPTVELTGDLVVEGLTTLNGGLNAGSTGIYSVVLQGNVYVAGQIDAETTINPGVPPP